MKFEEIVRHIGSVLYMPPERGKLIYEFILRTKPERALELGFAHGTSSCYIAAAMQENGRGHLLTIDNKFARERKPDINTLLHQTGLDDFVEPVFCNRSYTWELMKLLEKHTENGRTETVFDFVFIDGGHTWDSDGFSFLLTNRLLKPGGWVLFDDLLWTPSTMQGETWVDEMPEEERNVAHIGKVLSMFGVPNAYYGNVEFDGTWAWAQKKSGDTPPEDRTSIVKDIYSKTSRARRSFLVRRYLKKLFGKS